MLKFLFLSWMRRFVSFYDYFMHSANVFPNILLAMTLLPNPVYPGMGFYKTTYSFPFWMIVLLCASYWDLYSSYFCLNPSVLVRVNWSISGPVWFKYCGYIRNDCTASTVTLVLGTPTISAAVLCSICDGGIQTYCWVETYLCLAGTSCPLTKFCWLTSKVILPYVLAYKF